MRDYPPPSNYANMLSSPQGIRLAFRDKGLQSCSVETDKLGMPRARSGAFAVVYRLNMPEGTSKAVRLFLKEEGDRQDRYKRIFEYLSRLSLPCLVPFSYQDSAFRAADNKKYPMMTMDWVVGETLYDWLHSRAMAGDVKALVAISEKWRRTVQGLRDAKIAHGDLQHANVMVTRTGDIKLVDYDGMCVPALVGRRNLETGVDPYQHPGRNGDTQLSLGLDNFSAILIYVALRALAADPRLWNDFVVAKQYDKIMLTRHDLEDPGKSPLIQRMKRSADSAVHRLTGTLLDIFRGRLDQVPCLEDLFVAFDYQQVSVALDRKDFDAAVGMLARNGKHVAQAPQHLQTRLREAEQRVAKLTELLGAISAGDEQRTLALSASPLLRGYPGAATGLAVAKDAAAVLMTLRKLDVARTNKRWRELVKEWDAAQPLLTRPTGTLRKSAEHYRDEVHLWRVRNELCDKILAMLRSTGPNSDELERLWRSLNGYGGHPECDAKKAAIEAIIMGRQRPATPVAALATPPPRAGTSGAVTQTPLPSTRPGPAATPTPPPSGRGITAMPPPPSSKLIATTSSGPVATTHSPAPQPQAGATSVAGASWSPRKLFASSGTPLVNPGWHSQSLQDNAGEHATRINDTPSTETVAPQPESPLAAMAGWLVEVLTDARFDVEVFWQALICGWRSAIGGFLGAIVGLGTALAMANATHPGLRFTSASLLFGLIATGIVMGFLHGRDAVIGRPTFTVSRWFFTLTTAAVTAAIAAAATLAINAHAGKSMTQQYYGAPFSLVVNLKSFGGALSWSLLAVGIVTAIRHAVPNVLLGLVVSSGLVAGGLSWLAMHAFQDERMSLLFGVTLLGLLTAVLVTITEAASRDWFIEFMGGHGRLARINIGSVPVLVGADPATCHVVRPGAGIPVALKYWMESGQPFLMDCAGPRTYHVSAGDRRPFSGMVIALRSLARGGMRGATAINSTSPNPVPASSRGTGGSRPAVAFPVAVSTPTAVPVARPPRTPPPPPPPPRART